MKKFLTVLLAVVMTATLVFVGCKNNDEKAADPESVTITNTQTTLQAGEYTLTAEVKPAGASQAVSWTLVGNPLGVKLDGNKLTVAATAPNESTFRVRVAVQTDPTINDTKQFTVDNPPAPAIEISTEAELRAMELDKNYVLANDIELTDLWEPLGELNNPDEGIAGLGLSGTLDGNGYSIKNISMVIGTADAKGYNKGFFYKIEATGVIKNLGFESLKDDGEGVTGLGSWNGVITAHNYGRIENCFADVQAAEVITPFGSFIGTNESTGVIENCYAIGEIDAEAAGANGSGFVTVNSGTITNSYVLDTSVTAAIGLNNTQNANIQKSESWMKTAQNYKDAGWDEEVWSLVDGYYPQLKHDGFVAPAPKAVLSITNTEEYLDYNKEDERELQITYTLSNVTDNSVTFALKEAVTGVAIDNTGKVTLSSDVADGAKFTVVVTSVEVPELSVEKTFTVSNANIEEVVEIDTLEKLKNLMESSLPTDMAKSYRLTANIDASGEFLNSPIAPITDTTEGSEAAAYPFVGTFDGNGYSIIGFKCDNYANYSGLFGEIGLGGVVKNLTLTIGAQHRYMGAQSAAIASINRGTIENVKVEGDGEIRGTSQWVAGIAYNNYGTIKNCISQVKVSNEGTLLTIRGLVGNDFEGTITNCFVDTTVTGIEHIYTAENALDAACIKTTEQLKNADLYSAFDTTVWNIEAGSVPTLKNGCTAPATGNR